MAYKQRGKLLTLETATATRLCALPTVKIIEANVDSIFGISEKRFQELWDGDDFSSDVEELKFNLAAQYQSDMNHAANQRDVDEVAYFLKKLRYYWKRYYDHNEVAYFPEEVTTASHFEFLNRE